MKTLQSNDSTSSGGQCWLNSWRVTYVRETHCKSLPKKKQNKVTKIMHVFISTCVSSKAKKTNQQTQGKKENLPVFSFISHKTLKRAGFILWQFSACFLKRGGFIQTSGNRPWTTYTHKIYMLFPLKGGRHFIKHAGAAKENGKYLQRIHIFFKSHLLNIHKIPYKQQLAVIYPFPFVIWWLSFTMELVKTIGGDLQHVMIAMDYNKLLRNKKCVKLRRAVIVQRFTQICNN